MDLDRCIQCGLLISKEEKNKIKANTEEGKEKTYYICKDCRFELYRKRDEVLKRRKEFKDEL